MSCTVSLLSEIVNTVSMLVTICDMFDAIGIDAVLQIEKNEKMRSRKHENIDNSVLLCYNF